MTAIDIEYLRGWIGRSETAHDVVTPRLVREVCATLGCDVPPATLHWCLAPPAVAETCLGRDGHPARGGFLPPVPLSKRMWAESSLTFHDALRVGDAVDRVSQVVDVAAKQGRTGPLCFVTVEHRIATARGPAITERQTIVYRDEALSAPRAEVTIEPSDPDDRHRTLTATTTQLFRYSALTFNGHRIHYDRDYARWVEGYPGLVVHGPLLATQLLDLAGDLRGAVPTQFAFRGVRPVFDGIPYHLCAQSDGDALTLCVETDSGGRMMTAEARW